MKFLFGSGLDPHGERDHADSFGKQADKLLQRTGSMGRFYVADDASPTLEHKPASLGLFLFLNDPATWNEKSLFLYRNDSWEINRAYSTVLVSVLTDK